MRDSPCSSAARTLKAKRGRAVEKGCSKKDLDKGRGGMYTYYQMLASLQFVLFDLPQNPLSQNYTTQYLSLLLLPESKGGKE
jgi:hypothetical protein